MDIVRSPESANQNGPGKVWRFSAFNDRTSSVKVLKIDIREQKEAKDDG